MPQEYDGEDLVVDWTLLPGEETLVGSKRGPARLGFAVLLKFFQREGRFPQRPQDVPPRAVAHLAAQVGIPAAQWSAYDWDGRAIKYHRAEIRTLLGFREATLADSEALGTWLGDQVLPTTVRLDTVLAAAYERLRDLRIEPPTRDRLDRLVRSALHAFEHRVCTDVWQHLSPSTRTALETLLAPELREPPDTDGDEASTAGGRALLHELRADPGRATLDNLFQEIAKLERIRALALPPDLFARHRPDRAPGLPPTGRGRRTLRTPSACRAAPDDPLGRLLSPPWSGTDGYLGGSPARARPPPGGQGGAEGRKSARGRPQTGAWENRDALSLGGGEPRSARPAWCKR